MTGNFRCFGDILCILLSFSIVILSTTEYSFVFFKSACGKKKVVVFCQGAFIFKRVFLKIFKNFHRRNIRSMESIDRVPKHLRHYQKWVPHDKIHRSCGAEVLPAPNSRRARPF